MTIARRLGVLLCAALLTAGCGAEADGAGGARPALTISAAASLKEAITAYAKEFDGAAAQLSFAGSDELAAQIRQGIAPDVFAAANTALPRQLHAEGLVEPPTVFAANRLVLAVPAGEGAVDSLADVAKAGTTLAVGSPSVPVGSYTRAALDRLPSDTRAAILANVRSQEPDVAGIVGKLTQGAVDAGFVYVSDVRAADGELRAIELPDRLQPSVSYAAAVVKGAAHPAAAQAFVDGLHSPAGRRALEAAGFEVPPPE